ncbi:hypothetical protein AB0L70_28210 [Kribbella sp. NPDC051952]|uniref:hypothetical protein n=1 Tax=Kribbella sp. NPDC051952 TaxID=3154851 RepID=UPI00343A72B6
MGTTGGAQGAKGRSGPPTPAVVGIGRSMRARDVSRPRQPVKRRPTATTTDDPSEGQTGGSSPVDS